jgi:hypothetical protein
MHFNHFVLSLFVLALGVNNVTAVACVNYVVRIPLLSHDFANPFPIKARRLC